MDTYYFEDFSEGDTFETRGRTVTDADLVNYAAVSGNYHPIHLDAERMRASSFGGRLVHGLAVLAIMEGQKVQTGLIEDSIIALYGFDEIRFLHPVFVGDTIHTELTVRGVEEHDAESGVVSLEETGVNQDDDELVVATTRSLVAKRPDAAGRVA